MKCFCLCVAIFMADHNTVRIWKQTIQNQDFLKINMAKIVPTIQNAELIVQISSGKS